MSLPRFEDLPAEYRVALEPGAGRAPVRIVARVDRGLQVHDVWDMRPTLRRPRGAPRLLEEGILSMEDAVGVGEDAQTNRRSSGGPLVR